MTFFLLVVSGTANSVEWPGGTLVSYDFDVSRPGTALDRTFTIREFRSYIVSLRFFYDGRSDLDRVFALVGEGSSVMRQGHTLPIHVEIFQPDRTDRHVVVDEVIQTKSSFVHAFTPPDFTRGAIGRQIVAVNLQPGTYEIRANTLQDSVEFAGTPCQLAIEARAGLRVLPNAK